MTPNALAMSQLIESNQQQMDYMGKSTKKPESILVTIESIHKMASNMILKKGLDSFKSKLLLNRGQIIMIPHSDKVSIEVVESMSNFAKFKFIDEDHTLGHVLEFSCLQMIRTLIDKTPKEIGVTNDQIILECISGYRQPHPLDNYMEVTIRTPNTLDLVLPGEYNQYSKPIGVLLMAVDHLIGVCDNLLSDAERETK
jgi:DNA-directed RNA polymerase subunit L